VPAVNLGFSQALTPVAAQGVSRALCVLHTQLARSSP
jgi:hypothetical protein